MSEKQDTENSQRDHRLKGVESIIQSTVKGPEQSRTDQGDISEASQTDQGDTSEASQSNQKQRVRQRNHVSMYLDQEQVNEINALYEELDKRHEEVFGMRLAKNKRFYPALIEHGLSNPNEIRDALHLK